MAKLNLNDIGTTLSESASGTINANNAAIEAALENTLSRDGTAPNTMGADIDMNGNDLLNVATLDADVVTVAGENINTFVTRAETAAESAEETLVQVQTIEDNLSVFDPTNYIEKANNGSDFADPAQTFINLGVYFGENAPLALPQHPAVDRRDDYWANTFRLGDGTEVSRPIIVSGTGSPEGVVTAFRGSLYLREDAAAGLGLYVKETGTGNTGWAAK